MSQSRSLSLTEAAANGVLGYAVALGTQLVVFPAVGLSVALDNLRIGAVFTLVLLARGYLLRRLFERLGVRGGG